MGHVNAQGKVYHCTAIRTCPACTGNRCEACGHTGQVSGYCALCDKIDRNSPKYVPALRRSFFPDEFADEPQPSTTTITAIPAMPRFVHPSEGPQIDQGSARHHPPSLMHQAANLAGAVGRTVNAAIHGQPVLVDEPTYNARLSVCRGENTGVACEYWQETPMMRCLKCGCAGAAKLRMAREGCPVGKWQAVTVLATPISAEQNT